MRPSSLLRAMRVALCIAPLALVGACGTTTAEPVGIGRSADQMKRSPCACIEIPMRPAA